MDRLVPGLAPSEYGKMPPSFHSNSQKLSQATKGSSGQPDHSGLKTESPTKPIRPPILARNEFDGVVSDDETDEESADDEEDEEDRPQVVGEIEVDMAEEEEEFLEFSRQALGITDGQWKDIIRDRKTRGGENLKSLLPKTQCLPLRSSVSSDQRYIFRTVPYKACYIQGISTGCSNVEPDDDRKF